MAARFGTVTEWDDPRGIGAVTDAAGTRYGFHCTALTDGSRTTTVGAAVVFTLRAGPLGEFEATGISLLPGSAPTTPPEANQES